MQCPKCGYRRQKKDNAFVPPTECPSCGIVYAKYESERLAGRIPRILRRPSPLDESTLKKARERVELRLREKMLRRGQDAEKARTMELARRIFLEQLRRRLAQGEKEALRAADKPGDETGPPAVHSQRTEQDHLAAAPAAVAVFNKIYQTQAESPSHPSFTRAGTENEASRQPSGSDRLQYEELEPEAFAQDQPPAENDAPQTAFRDADPPRWLPLAGIFSLIAGVVGALVSWATLEPAQAKTLVKGVHASQGLALELVIGFCYLAVGVLGGALFWTIFLTARRQNRMRRILAAARMEPPPGTGNR